MPPVLGGNPRSVQVLGRVPLAVNLARYGNMRHQYPVKIMTDDERLLLGLSFVVLTMSALGDVSYSQTDGSIPRAALSVLLLLPFLITILSRAPHFTGVFFVGVTSGIYLFVAPTVLSYDFAHPLWYATRWVAGIIWSVSLLWSLSTRIRYYLVFPFRPSMTLPRDWNADIDPETGEWHPTIQAFFQRHAYPRE
jgi:hypothetical protein